MLPPSAAAQEYENNCTHNGLRSRSWALISLKLFAVKSLVILQAEELSASSGIANNKAVQPVCCTPSASVAKDIPNHKFNFGPHVKFWAGAEGLERHLVLV